MRKEVSMQSVLSFLLNRCLTVEDRKKLEVEAKSKLGSGIRREIRDLIISAKQNAADKKRSSAHESAFISYKDIRKRKKDRDASGKSSASKAFCVAESEGSSKGIYMSNERNSINPVTCATNNQPQEKESFPNLLSNHYPVSIISQPQYSVPFYVSVPQSIINSYIAVPVTIFHTNLN